MQFQANISGATVRASTEEALSALGVALMAGRLEMVQWEARTFAPGWDEIARRKKLEQWACAIHQCSQNS